MSFSIKSLVPNFLYEPTENTGSDIDHENITHTPPASPPRNPCKTSFEVIALDELKFQALHSGVHYWRQLCGERRFPRREDLNPRGMAGLLRNTALVKVHAGGGDYEYRIVGDAIACAYRLTLQNHKLSDYETTVPTAVQSARGLFGIVVDSGMPHAIRRWTGYDAPESNFPEAETVILPLGVCDTAVDHLLIFSCYLTDFAGS